MLAATYVLHMYCDNDEGHLTEQGQVNFALSGGFAEITGEDFNDCAAKAHKIGWAVNRTEGTCRCPNCSGSRITFAKHRITVGCEARRLISIKELSAIIGRGEQTIRNDLLRAPESLPSRVKIPASNALRWDLQDVYSWMAWPG